jgi:tRNA (cytidine/uridine-2'-O-)-methyltransferase
MKSENDDKMKTQVTRHPVSAAPALALYQPDIAGNTGTLLRLSACLGTHLHIIGPAGFRADDSALKRAGMDYADLAAITRHDDYAGFKDFIANTGTRLVLMTTRASLSYTDFTFQRGDIIMMGRESAGVPDHVHDDADAALLIPMRAEARSLNQAVSAAMVLGEALRQTGAFPVI